MSKTSMKPIEMMKQMMPATTQTMMGSWMYCGLSTLLNHQKLLTIHQTTNVPTDVIKAWPVTVNMKVAPFKKPMAPISSCIT